MKKSKVVSTPAEVTREIAYIRIDLELLSKHLNNLIVDVANLREEIKKCWDR